MSQTDDKALHRRLTLNSISNTARLVLTMAIAFLLTPFIVRTLGDSLYGFWVLLMSFIGYASILEMGVQPAVVKLVGQYRAREEYEKLRELITTAFLFFCGVATLAVILVVTVVPIVVHQHVEGLSAIPRAQLLFTMIALDAVVLYMNYLFTGVLYGFQRYHLWNIIDAVSWVIYAGFVLVFLERGGIIALMAAKMSKDLLSVTLTTVAVLRIFPGFRLRLGAVSRDSFKELMGFGGRVFISGTTARIATHAQPLIISTSLSAAATSFYAIPVKLLDYTRALAWTLSASFMPMFSELESRNEQGMLRFIYLSYSRYIFMILLPILVLLYVYGPSFIGLWIGPEYAQRGETTLYLLTTTVLIESAQPLLWRFFVGVGRLNILVKVSATSSLLVVLLGIVLVRTQGIAGVALSVLVGAILGQVIYVGHACRYLGISVGSFFVQVHLRPLLVAATMAVAAVLLAMGLGTDDYASILAGALVAMALYAMLALPLALRAKERALLLRKVSAILQRGRPVTHEGG